MTKIDTNAEAVELRARDLRAHLFEHNGIAYLDTADLLEALAVQYDAALTRAEKAEKERGHYETHAEKLYAELIDLASSGSMLEQELKAARARVAELEGENARMRVENEWRPIESAPVHGKQIAVGFMGQFDWLSYIADARGANTRTNGFAPPTHWHPLPTPPRKET
jgi:chromosome segregation ATPase